MHRPTPIINRQLESPWMLLAVYDSLFETQISVRNKLEYILSGARNNGKPLRPETEARISMMEDAIEETAKSMRETDQKIHDYIKNNNQPKQKLKIA